MQVDYLQASGQLLALRVLTFGKFTQRMGLPGRSAGLSRSGREVHMQLGGKSAGPSLACRRIGRAPESCGAWTDDAPPTRAPPRCAPPRPRPPPRAARAGQRCPNDQNMSVQAVNIGKLK